MTDPQTSLRGPVIRMHSHLLTTSCLLALAALAVACGGGGGAGTSEGPVFYVTASDPGDGQQNVPVDSAVEVTFNEDVDPSSVHSNSLRVGVIGGAGEIPGTTVPADGDPRTIRWTPSGVMVGVSPHACEISSGLRSTDGDLVGGDLAFTFRTAGDTPGPSLPTQDDLRTLSATLHVGRRSHTATRLGGGQVLIAGGFRQGSDLTDRGEIYNGTGFALLTAPMVQARAGHTATLLSNGRVLLTGGYYEPTLGQLGTTEWAEIYDPSSQTFQRVGDMSVERVDHAALLLPDGRVLVTGGSRLDNQSVFVDHDTAEVFDPATSTFSALPDPMIHTRATHVMENMGNGTLLLSGGSDLDLRPSRFDTATETFSPLLPAAQDGQRWGAAAATFAGGDVCVTGGDSLATVIYVDAATGYVQNTGSSMNARRAYHTATRYEPNAVLAVGGYEFTTGFLSPTCDLIVERGIAGSETFGTTMRFSTGMVWHTATLLLDGTVLFCGGLNQTGGAPELDKAYLFTPP